VESYRVLFALDDASSSASLATWLERRGVDVSPGAPEGSMGAGEALSCAVIGSTALRAAVAVAQDWIRAHHTKISVQVQGRGSFEIEGSTDIDQLLDLLQGNRKEGESDG
jgi:hypothetical protein